MTAEEMATCPDCLGDPDTVCDACGQHSCWEGEFMCHEALSAGTVQKEDLHIGRSWSDTRLEDGCPCPKQPCGLVGMGSADPSCTEHPPQRIKTIRQSHPASACPGSAS
jgi:hypothetical protein